MPTNILVAAVVAVGLVIAAMFGRYEIVSAGAGQPVVYRIDRLTGRVESCQTKVAFAFQSNVELAQGEARQPKWCKPSLIG